jgi:hypothetical protein
MDDRQLAGHPPSRGAGSQPRHPEVAVDDVWTVTLPVFEQALGQLGNERKQVVLGDRLGRAGPDVSDDDSSAEPDRIRQTGVVPTGVNGHLVAAVCHRSRQRCNVDVLTSRIYPAHLGERAGVL